MTNRGTFCVILLTLFVSVHCQSEYNCLRLNNCQNSATCASDTGTCTCTGTYANYDCGMDSTHTDCALDCQNGGTCKTTDTGDTCFCLYGFYGTNCELANADVICSGNKVELILAFPDVFAGEVVLVNGDTPSNPVCPVTETVDGSYKKYSIAIDISAAQDDAGTPCKIGNLKAIVDPVVGTIYSTTLRVQYMQNIISSLDELYTGNCSHETETVLDQDISNVAVDNKNLSLAEYADVYKVLDMVTLDANDALVTVDTEMYVGTPFKLVAYLTEATAYDTVRFESCETNNTLEDPTLQQTFVILDQGCPTQRSMGFTKEQVVTTYNVDGVALPAMELPVDAFKFSNSDMMGILCTGRICKPGDDTCAPPADCEAVRNSPAPPAEPTTAPVESAATPAEGVRRKRRAADDVSDDVENEEILSAVITVRGPNDVSGQSKNTAGIEQPLATVENCFTRSEILAVVSVLAGIVCILLIACLMLACLLIKRKAKSTEFESMSVPTSDRFRIPRAHVNDAFTLREV